LLFFEFPSSIFSFLLFFDIFMLSLPFCSEMRKILKAFHWKRYSMEEI
jgi:hypothetical protein